MYSSRVSRQALHAAERLEELRVEPLVERLRHRRERRGRGGRSSRRGRSRCTDGRRRRAPAGTSRGSCRPTSSRRSVDALVGERAHVRVVVDRVRRRHAGAVVVVALHEDDRVRRRARQLDDPQPHLAVRRLDRDVLFAGDREPDRRKLVGRVEADERGAADDAELHGGWRGGVRGREELRGGRRAGYGVSVSDSYRKVGVASSKSRCDLACLSNNDVATIFLLASSIGASPKRPQLRRSMDEAALLSAAADYVAWDPNAETRAEVKAHLDAKDVAALSKLLDTKLEFGTAGLRAPMQAGRRAQRAHRRAGDAGPARRPARGLRADCEAQGPPRRDRLRPPRAARSARVAACLAAEALASRSFNVICPASPTASTATRRSSRTACARAAASLESWSPPRTTRRQTTGHKVYWDNGAQIILRTTRGSPPRSARTTSRGSSTAPRRTARNRGRSS